MKKEEASFYLKNNELDIARATAALLMCDLVYGSYVDSDVVHGVTFSPGFCYFFDEQPSHFYQIFAKQIIVDVGKQIYLDYMKDPSSINKKIEAHVVWERAMDHMWNEYDRGQPHSKESTGSAFLAMIEVAKRWWYYAAIGEDKGAVILAEIIPKFSKRHSLSTGEADALFNTLSHPTAPTIFNLERVDFLDICLSLLHNENVEPKTKTYIEKYFWFKTNFYEAKPLTHKSIVDDALHQIEQKGEVGITNERQDITDSFKKLQSEKEALEKTVSLSSEDRKDLFFAQKVIEWIDIRKFGMMKSFYYLLMMLRNISQQSNIEYPELSLYTIDELRELIKLGKQIAPDELSDRVKGAFITWEKGGVKSLVYGKEAKELFGLATNHDHQGDIQGQLASRGKGGKFSGIVRIVHNPAKDIFNKGEILVTSMTRVEFVPLMRIAKAIITDEGGIACHAAIVSRELGLPCIIGTKIGTGVLKDGDLVEVDADKGIVRKITQ